MSETPTEPTPTGPTPAEQARQAVIDAQAEHLDAMGRAVALERRVEQLRAQLEQLEQELHAAHSSAAGANAKVWVALAAELDAETAGAVPA